jgi:hypothetical protein
MPQAKRLDQDRSPESLEVRLRGLPQPCAPVGLERRLLASIPAGRPIPRRGWVIWAGVAASLVAAGLLVELTWRRDGSDHRGTEAVTGKTRPAAAVAKSGMNRPGNLVPSLAPDESASIAEWREARRVLNGAEPASFAWPLEGSSLVSVSMTFPADLLD